ncbi:MAG: GTPase ObgE [Elusimicrobia bacterium]|nr:GTPase ObgE [Elusimicrobiota bacterium]MDE2426469.1 GTPase ObgE [Elusimicrobiota bacterium]
MSFIDKVRVFAKAGDGGDGCLSFLREKFMEFGGPNGADGGKGGDIFLRADAHVTTLLELARRPHLGAQAGAPGKGNAKTGAAGADTEVAVPAGTAVYRDGVLVADLSEAGMRWRAAAGGRGGRGNLSFKSRLNTAPRICEKGEPGQAVTLDLELKLIADVGLVGFPNAGKSSLLSVISAARPKVAGYPFTTLSPHLGVASHKGVSFVVADIPGLIAGAHRGKGLGLEFLRHVERTRLLLHLIDPLGYGGSDPEAGIGIIERELEAFSPRLAKKPRLLVVNKMDLPEGGRALPALRAKRRRRGPLGISAATGAGLGALLDRVIAELAKAPAARGIDPAPRPSVTKVDAGFKVENKGGGVFLLRGRFVERAAAMLDATLPEAVDRFQRTLKKIGVDKALKRAGIAAGDMVRCGGHEFEWSERPYQPLRRLRRAHKRTRIDVGRKR